MVVSEAQDDLHEVDYASGSPLKSVSLQDDSYPQTIEQFLQITIGIVSLPRFSARAVRPIR